MPELNSATPTAQPSVGSAVKAIALDAALNTTTHGIGHLVRSELLLLRILWVVCLLAALGGCIYIQTRNVTGFLKYEVVTNIRLVYEKNTSFPTVTVCSLNALATPSALRYAEARVALLKLESGRLNESIDFLLDDFDEMRYFIATTASDPRLGNDTRRSLGLPLEDMLLSCYFNNEVCNASDFEWTFSNQYGNCYVFNSGRNSRGESVADKVSTKAGKTNGLRLDLYVPEPTNYYSFSTAHGAHIYINSQNALPQYSEGYDISVGEQSNLAVSRTRYSRQSAPYSTCIAEADLARRGSLFARVFAASGLKYSQSECFNLCYQRRASEVCHCYDLDYPQMTFGQVACVSLANIICIDQLYGDFFTNEVFANCSDECPEECERVDYAVTQSTALYPTEVYANERLVNDSILRPLLWNVSAGPLAYETIKRNLASVNVYYNELAYSLFEESPKTELSDLVSNVGGSMGLFAGISLLTLIEAVQIGVRVVRMLLLRHRQNKLFEYRIKF